MSDRIHRLRAVARREPYLAPAGEDTIKLAIEDLANLVLGHEIAIRDQELKIERLERRLRASVNREARR